MNLYELVLFFILLLYHACKSMYLKKHGKYLQCALLVFINMPLTTMEFLTLHLDVY